MSLEQLTQNMQQIERVQGIYKKFEPALKKAAEYAGVEGTLRDQTGLEGALGTLSEQEQRQAQAAQIAQGLIGKYQKKAVEYIKSDLDSIVSAADEDKLLAAIMRIKPDEETELGKKMMDYQIYAQYLNPPKPEKGQEDKYKEIARNIEAEVMKRIPEMVKERILKNKPDQEFADDWAMLIAAISDKGYVAKLINEKAKELQDSIKEYIGNRGNVTTYLNKCLTKDEEYLGFGSLIYNLHKEKDED